MTLRQIARTPRAEYPEPIDLPYAFAREVVASAPRADLDPLQRGRIIPVLIVVRCPWCGHSERISATVEGRSTPCQAGRGSYVPVIPERTPVMQDQS